MEDLKGCGVDVSHVRKLQNVETGQAFIILDSKGENSIILLGGANMQYSTLTELPPEYVEGISRSKNLLAKLYTLMNLGSIVLLQNEIPQEINILVAKKGKELGTN